MTTNSRHDTKKSFKRATFICIALGIFLGISTYTFYYANGAAYLSNDPKACVNCHVMQDQYNGWVNSSHHAVATCNDCHTPHAFIAKYLTKMENGYHHSVAFTLQNFHEPIRMKEKSAKIANHACLECHGSFVGEIAAHMGPKDKVNACIRCHVDVGH